MNPNTIWDKLVFNSIKQKFGGNVRLVVVGSAPIHADVLTFVRCALGCLILEGYGQTESAAPCTLTMAGDNEAGHVGPPLPCCDVKLIDVPDMGLDAARDGQGEVCIRGSTVFPGYYKEAKKTAETLTKDKWLRTGDIGRWTENGTLKIVDRCKHIFKLSQGEYVVPERVEGAYGRNEVVLQCYVYGESLKSVTVAIVVANEVVLREMEKKMALGLQDASFEQLCQDVRMRKAVMERINADAKKSGIASYELAKAVYLEAEMFSVENGLMTPTMKVRRADIKTRYATQLQALYSELEK